MIFYDFYEKPKNYESFKAIENLILVGGWNKYWSLFAPSPHSDPQRQQKSPAWGQNKKVEPIVDDCL